MPAAAPAVLLLSLDTQQGVSNIILAMTRRDFGKPAFSLRKKTLRENTCTIASGDYSTPVSQRWHQEKHDVAARRTWRKLHLAIDENHQLLACELTIPEVGDPTAVPDLLAKIDTPFETFMGDGA